jgi:hypothetical protein
VPAVVAGPKFQTWRGTTTCGGTIQLFANTHEAASCSTVWPRRTCKSTVRVPRDRRHVAVAPPGELLEHHRRARQVAVDLQVAARDGVVPRVGVGRVALGLVEAGRRDEALRLREAGRGEAGEHEQQGQRVVHEGVPGV